MRSRTLARPEHAPRSLVRGPLLALALVLALVLSAGCFGQAEDDDLLPADAERDGWEVTAVTPDGSKTWRVTSDPHREDTDGDGRDDFVESVERTDPRDPDTDADGLLDGADVVLPEDDPRVDDWRERGITEGQAEGGVRFLGESGDGQVARGGDPLHADTDDDGLLDGEEAGGYTVSVNGSERTVFTAVRAPDSDNDRIFDGRERELGLDPTQRDTDGDGVFDGGDIDPWQDLGLRFLVQHLEAEASGRDVRLVVQHADQRWESPPWDLSQDEAPWPFDSGRAEARDDAGVYVEDRTTMRLLVTVVAGADQDPEVLDVSSDQTAVGGFVAVIDTLDGTLFYEDASGQRQSWPTGGFTGSDGSLRMTIETA